MAQHSGFFNALQTGGVYDRKYNAEDYSDFLAVVISNGIVRSTADDLKVTASGLNLSVNSGRAAIKGKWYHNDDAYTLPAIEVPVGASRIDRVVLRYNKNLSVRDISIAYITGTAATSPTATAITRTDAIYDLCLADVLVTSGGTVTVTDTRADADLCGWLYSTSGDNSFFTSLDNAFYEWFGNVRDTLASVTLFRRYTWQTELQSQTSTVQFDIAEYDENTDFIEVYINGMLTYDYSVASDLITFNDVLTAGTQITVNSYKSVDGSELYDETSVESIFDQLGDLQTDFATIEGASKYIYKATGLNDNISLSEIAQAIYAGSYVSADVTEAADAFLTALGGNAYLGGLASDAKITIDVVGDVGASTATSGTGVSGDRFVYFDFSHESQTKRIVFDFAKANRINIECAASSYNTIFFAADVDIKNLYLSVTSAGAGSNIQIFADANTGAATRENCNVELNATGAALYATNGTFINCNANVQSNADDAYCFYPKTSSLVNIVGGTYLAYTAGGSSKTSAVFYTDSLEANPVIIAANINAPERSVTGYEQKYLAIAYGGNMIINTVVTPLTTTGSYVAINNLIPLSK